MDRGKWEIRGEVRKWTDVPLHQGPQIILSVDCDAFGLTANVSGIKVPGDPLTGWKS
jgi:hypothetical protein